MRIAQRVMQGWAKHPDKIDLDMQRVTYKTTNRTAKRGRKAAARAEAEERRLATQASRARIHGFMGKPLRTTPAPTTVTPAQSVASPPSIPEAFP